MDVVDFIRADSRRWLFPLRSSVIFAEYGASAIREFVQNEVLEGKASFLPCCMAFALKDHVHLRRTLVLDPIATFFLFDFVVRNTKHFKSPAQSGRRAYGYAFDNGEPVDSFGEYHQFRRRKYELKTQYKYYAATDIANCFNSFYHHDIVEAIESQIDLEASHHFGQFLREINAGSSVNCFPQGLYPAKAIGSWFLSFIESSRNLKSPAIIRFLDDIYFFSDDESCVYEDVIVLQRILAEHALSLNAEKTRFGRDNSDFEERELDAIKKRLLVKRERRAMAYDDSDTYDDDKTMDLDEGEIEYLEDLVGKKNVAEEDVELALSLVRDRSEIQMKLATLVLKRFPHLLKSLHTVVKTIDGYDSQLFELLRAKLAQKVLTEFELFWLVRIALDHYTVSASLVDLLIDIYRHPSATSVVHAAILECPEMKYGLHEMKADVLRQESGTLAGVAAMVGLQEMGKGKRNQLYKYAAKAGQHMELLCKIMKNV